MGALNNFERRLIGKGTTVATKLLHTAVHTFSDYKHRHIAGSAASVSFYAIFSVFPLLAFSVYVVGKLIGDDSPQSSAPMVIKMVHEFVPAMQGWVEKGLFNIITGNTVTNWVNALLLGWSGVGLFDALLAAIEHLPGRGHHAERSHTGQALIAAVTLGLFAILLATVVFCELVGGSQQIPIFLQGLPFSLQDVAYYAGRSRALLIVVSVGIVAVLYKLLLPVKVRVRSVFVAALLFTGLLLLSRSAYWIYLHYNQHSIQSTYGVFSALILNMLWVHFISSCMLFSCLFALHLDKAAGFSQYVSHHSDDEHHDHKAA